MHPRVSSAAFAVLAVLLCMLGLAGSARAVTVSTTDGMTLTLTSTGAFSSLTVDGNTVPTLAGVAGGFFIVPMDGVAINPNRTTYYPGTQITGTATQSGSDIHLTTSTIQNQTFDIWLRGGLPYIKIDGTVTGNGTDHTFLIDFRIPVDATGWTWGNRVNQPQTIVAGSSNWYFANIGFHWVWHPQLSVNPYGTVSKTTSPTMGLSLSPLFYPPAAYVIEYNSQTGFFIEFELGTTNKTTKHPNTADFHCVFYKHDPKWGNRSAVQRLQSFFPQWFLRSVTGGNWYIDCDHANYPTDPEDFRLKFCEGVAWSDAITEANGMLTCRYIEPWCWHIWTDTDVNGVWAETADIDANWLMSSPPCHCPGNRGMSNAECAQAVFNSMAKNPDGTYIGPDNPDLWTDYGSSWRWICNPDPEIGNWQQFTPGTTRAGNAEFRESYWLWDIPPSVPQNHYEGVYWDSIGGYWAGWDVVHNFNANHWPTYDYSPGIYWGSILYNGVNYGDGLVCMWAPFSNVELLRYGYEQMRKEGRIVIANSALCFENVMAAPFLDMWGSEDTVANSPATTLSLMRAIAGQKPLSFLHSRDGYNLATATELKLLLPYAIYPGAYIPDMSITATATEFDSLRSTYQQYMPIFDALDDAGWNPITAAVPADTAQTLERFGPNASAEIFYALHAPGAGTATVTVYYADLGWSANPNVTVTALLGAAPSVSYSSGNLVLSFGSITAGDARVVKIVYNGTSTVPVASFSGSPTSGSAPLAVSFTDSSTQSPTAWYWDFGDGSVSTAQSPSHTYAGGTYIVSMTAINASGQDTIIKDNYITANAAPVADFAYYRVSGILGRETTAEFQDKSTNSPTSWSWTFGDGGTSTAQNPTHTYTAVGSYNVALTAYNASGSDTETKTGLVNIVPQPLTYIGAGAVKYGTGAITPALPSGIQTNDILLLFLETANQAISVTNQNGGTWTQVTNSPQGYGTAAATNATRLTVFWSRYNGTQGNPTVSDSGNHQIGRIIAIRGAATSGDPCNVTAGGTESTADTSGSIPGATTTVDNTLVVLAIATSLPDSNGTANFSAWANSDLSSVTERTDDVRNVGNGGGLGIATGAKATAGAYGTTSVTCAVATTKAMMSIAIKP